MTEPVVAVQTLALERLHATHGDVGALRQFVDDQIGVLDRTNAAKGSQLLLTLRVWLACGGSKAEAAKRLHIRRRSLYYRLDLIAKLIDVHLEDPKQMMMFSVAMTARRIAGVG